MRRGAVRRRSRWWPALFGALAVIALALPSSALPSDCCVYWSTGFNGTIGRAPLRGFYPQWDFIHAPGDGVFGLAVDRAHLYWGGEASIGRVGLDGSDLESGLIAGLADSRQSAVAVDDAHAYWVEPGENSIGRANLDGSDVDEEFIGAELPVGLALGNTHVYWANGIENAIASANLDGSGVDETLIGGASLPAGVAVDDAHVYWTNFGSDSIGRANLDGSEADQDFIGQVTDPWGIAVDETGIYWTGLATGAVGRANLDGSRIDEGLIERVGALNVALGEPGPIGRVRAKRFQGQRSDTIRVRIRVTARQRLTTRASGTLTVRTGERISYGLGPVLPRTHLVGAGETEAVLLKPQGRSQERRIVRALEDGTPVTAEIGVRLVDRIGNREVKRRTVRLRRRTTAH